MGNMPERRFPPWTVEEYRGISYIVRDANNFPAAYIYFESERGRRAARRSTGVEPSAMRREDRGRGCYERRAADGHEQRE